MSKTIAIFGAGSGLGTSVARRFGAEGYRVALVARRLEPLERLTDALTAEGIEAAPFTADLADEDAAVAVLDAIRERLGRIDVLYYAPVSIETGFIPARELRAGALRDLLQLYVLTPVELVHAVLPEMLERGDGAILVGHGHTAIAPRAHMSGVGPAMAAMRNYLHSLHDELAGSGIYVGTLAITAMIARSAAHSALTSGTIDLPPDLPVVDPDELADRLWELATERDEVELVHPPITATAK